MEESPRKLPHKLKKPYRLVILNEDSLEEIGSYRLTPLSLYILSSSLLVTFMVAFTLLVAYTPVKRWIPGYGYDVTDTELARLRTKVRNMERQLDLQKRYTENIRMMITGKLPEPPKEQADKAFNDSLVRVARIEEDEILRQDFLLGEGLERPAAATAETSGSANTIPLERIIFTAPLNGQVSADFDPRKDHLGIDVIAPKNTPVKAVLDGYVVFADWTLETGNAIGIQHDNQVVTFYKHNSMLLKKAGAFVKAGEAIAIIGNTGTKSSGPHLHFELWHKGKAVDPARYIRF